MLTIKMTTLLPINCYYGYFGIYKKETVLILIPSGYTLFLVYRPTLHTSQVNLITSLLPTVYAHDHTNLCISSVSSCSII